MTQLLDVLKPCGPVADPKAADRARNVLVEVATRDGWLDVLDAGWPALAPVFGASPYLTSLARRDPARLRDLLISEPDARFADLLIRTTALASADWEAAKSGLRKLKAEAHLLIALADLGGVWDLDAVTGSLTRFADAALYAALSVAAQAELDAGRLTRIGTGEEGPVPGWFCIAMGKHGAYELNYSSDIDISVFYEPEALPLAEGVETQGFAVRLTQRLAELMQDKTGDGYVFRVDLRLRPDPGSTPVALSVDAAIAYYESRGQNWERAAWIKSRPCAGDKAVGEAFLKELTPYVWRKHLDFAMIADIQAMKRRHPCRRHPAPGTQTAGQPRTCMPRCDQARSRIAELLLPRRPRHLRISMRGPASDAVIWSRKAAGLVWLAALSGRNTKPIAAPVSAASCRRRSW